MNYHLYYFFKTFLFLSSFEVLGKFFRVYKSPRKERKYLPQVLPVFINPQEKYQDSRKFLFLWYLFYGYMDENYKPERYPEPCRYPPFF